MLGWIVLIGVLVLEGLNRLRIYLGYEPFDSQWGMIGLASFFGFILVFFLALFNFVVSAVGLVLTQRGQNRGQRRRLLLGLGLNLAGFLIFVFL